MAQLMRDPVCGMELSARDAVASVMSEGIRFYFCCVRCHAAFLDTPHRFVGWGGDPPALLPAAITTRTRANLESCRFAS